MAGSCCWCGASAAACLVVASWRRAVVVVTTVERCDAVRESQHCSFALLVALLLLWARVCACAWEGGYPLDLLLLLQQQHRLWAAAFGW